jgi:dTDP-D-glucose 4,6-dehydratase
LDSHVVPALIRKFDEALSNNLNEVTIWGSGQARREFMHVDDLANACIFLLENYRKGVMKQIFSREIRFKNDDGNDYIDWEDKKLSEIANKKSSNISANKIVDNFGDYIIYGASGILKKVDFYKEEDLTN